MQTYSGRQWTLIDAAARHGMDKAFFSERLTFGRAIKDRVATCIDMAGIKEEFKEDMVQADEPEMFAAALIANDKPSGFMIGHDVSQSGPQLLSVLTRCKTGMINTGAIDSINIPDLYNIIAQNMPKAVIRNQVKNATVPYVYGSIAVPEAIFGDDLPVFVQAYAKAVPGASWAKSVLLNAWNPTALYHEIRAPDGGYAHMKVITSKDYKGKFKGYTYTYRTTVNEPVEEGKGIKSLPANITHLADGYVVRELGRRCNYDMAQIQQCIDAIKQEQFTKSTQSCPKLIDLYQLSKRSNIVSVVAAEHIQVGQLANVSNEYLNVLLELFYDMLLNPPYPIRAVHDEYACYPDNMNNTRYWYNRIMSEFYESTWLIDIVQDLTGVSYHSQLDPIDPEITKQIRQATYALH